MKEKSGRYAMKILPHCNRLFFLLLAAGMMTSVSALIVWNGTIVPEWPEQQPPSLRKTTAASDSAKGFGFYPQPRGKIYCLTMIVDFSDEPAVFTKEQIDGWLNGKDSGSTSAVKESVRDYYYECSNGAVELINDVAGYYRAKKPRSYYEGFTDYTGATQLVAEMIDHFDPEIDFSKYDNDGNGSTEAISIVYAGSGKEWGKGLWPHSGNISRKCDGVQLSRYNMSDMGKQLTLYVFCHETGHMLFGWPDLYWFGDYCIMGNRMSDTNPQAVNDFFRADQGWIPVTDISPDDNLAFTAAHNGDGFRFVNPNEPREMFFWSVIRAKGRWSNVRGNGILLYHFDARIKGNTSGSKRTLYVVEADGDNRLASEQWPSPGYDTDDFFSATTADEFSATTKPPSQWGLRIYDISAAGDTMSFAVGTGVVSSRLPSSPFIVQPSGNSTMMRYDLLGRALDGVITPDFRRREKVSGWYVSGKGVRVFYVR